MHSINEHVLIDRGRRLAVVADRGPTKTTATLVIDGDQSGAVSGSMLDTKTIDLDDEKVRVQFGWKRDVKRAELLDGAGKVIGGVWFEPPAGTSAHRLWRFRTEHPGLYAARRVVASALGAVATVVGLGALVHVIVERLAPKIDLPDVPLPTVDLPEWMRYLNPGYWLRAPFDVIRSWLPSMDIQLPSWLGIAIPIAISIGLALAEARRQRRRRASSGDSGGDDAHR